MLSISVFLLLAGWKGVRGGLSQLIYHIKYQPSSIFSLPFPVPHFFPHSLFLTSYHLHLSFSLVLSTFLSLPPFSRTLPLSFPHTFTSEPSSTFLKVPNPISLTIF